MSKINVDEIKDRIAGITESLGFELVDISAPVVGGRLILRLAIYSPKGVNLDDCAKVSRTVSEKLDADDPIKSRYTLEVSSLGLDRPLLTARDFQRRIGEKIKVSFNENETRHTVEGILSACDENEIKIKNDEEMILIPVNANPRGKIII
jgi:ribosome maturation factor RimP